MGKAGKGNKHSSRKSRNKRRGKWTKEAAKAKLKQHGKKLKPPSQ